jgi:hypothetical protein
LGKHTSVRQSTELLRTAGTPEAWSNPTVKAEALSVSKGSETLGKILHTPLALWGPMKRKSPASRVMA